MRPQRASADPFAELTANRVRERCVLGGIPEEVVSQMRSAARFGLWCAGGLAVLVGLVAWAAGPVMAAPEPWEINFQPPATPVMRELESFHVLLLWVIFAISIFVLALLLYTSWRFAEKRNPTPSRRSHHTVIEVIWTAVPVLILVIIAIPSFKLLYYAQEIPQTEMTIKATGHQWYWSYDYPDRGGFTFDANLSYDLQPGQPRLLQTDNELVVPAGVNVKLLVTAADVLHSWAMPQFGVKMDAVPGRLNETWFHVEEPGVYYGQCSELCGVQHGFMPITLRAVPKDEFDRWVEEAKQKFAQIDGGPPPPVRTAEDGHEPSARDTTRPAETAAAN